MKDKDINRLRLKTVLKELEELIDKLGLISIGEAATMRETTRSAILQLMQRGRLTVEKVLDKQLVYKDEIKNFTAQKPGPQIDSIPKPKS